jgi:alkylation response protein AidB-like acyl-CoA dehydrogenase
MDFDLSSEQLMLQQGARRFISERMSVAELRAIGLTQDGFSPQHWASFADLGWLSLVVPEDAGGLGATDVDLALLMEEIGRGATVSPFLDTAVIGETLVQASRNTALRDELLTGIAAGTCRTALAHLEPESRSEYQTSVATCAEQLGDGWKLTGVKRCVVNGPAATHWLVTAQAGGADPSLFVTDARASGVTRTDYALIDGSRACDLRMTSCPAALLLTSDQGSVLELALDRAVVALSAAAVGSMEAVMGLCADHLKQRTQFGQPLSKFQALQHRMAEMFIETDQARSMLCQALAALESGDSERRRRAASGAKWLVSRAGNFVVSQGIQLHGGIGITDEYAVAHHYKSMFMYDKRFGDAAFHLRRSAGLSQGPR